MDALTREPATTATRPRARRLVMLLASVALIAAVGATLWFWPSTSNNPAKDRFANEPIPVLVATATRRDVPIYLDGLGTVQAFYTVTIKPMVDGPLVAVDFHEGEDVRKGDVLARIDPRTFQAALDQTTAKKAQDEALLANARVDLTRYQKLVSNAYTSAQQADTQKSLVAQLEAQLRQDQAQIDTTRTQLSYCTIIAPIDGRTGIRQVDPGNIVHAADSSGASNLVMLTQLQPISVVFTLPQQSLPAVAHAMADGMPKALAVTQGGVTPGVGTEAIGAQTAGAQTPGAETVGTSTVLDRGTLAVLDNQVDPTTGTIKLKATFPNAKRVLWPGGFVGVRLLVDTARAALTVPPAAVQRGPRGTYVYVIDAASTAHRRDVTVAHEDQEVSIIATGLQPGDRVVTDGAARLAEDTKVAIAEPVPKPPDPPAPAVPGGLRGATPQP
ncbi:MAG TPA: efflux RND transporter periplasmic adaptor subunit [Acetobacteraceae bacterium]|jgi:multidrug efflux system membrane fusion protein|nr:efflux RND transporter periplasmic adaptor subunit [Acetobacteraceae bacterium]